MENAGLKPMSQKEKGKYVYSRTLKTPVTYRLYGEQNSV